jgi:hypothetical protein
MNALFGRKAGSGELLLAVRPIVVFGMIVFGVIVFGFVPAFTSFLAGPPEFLGCYARITL